MFVLVSSRLKGTPGCSAYSTEGSRAEVSLLGPRTHSAPVSGRCVLTWPVSRRFSPFPRSGALPLEPAAVRLRSACRKVAPWRYSWQRCPPGRLSNSCSWLAPKQNLDYKLFFQWDHKTLILAAGWINYNYVSHYKTKGIKKCCDYLPVLGGQNGWHYTPPCWEQKL